MAVAVAAELVVVVVVVVVVTVTIVVVVMTVVVVAVLVMVRVDWCDVLGPSAQGDPYAKMACASWAYVHPSLTFVSEKPALHIMMPPKRSASPYSLTSAESCAGVM